MDKKCVICGQKFNGRPNRIYCGIRCRRKAEKMVLVQKKREGFEKHNPNFWEPGQGESWRNAC